MTVYGNTTDTLANWLKGRDPDQSAAEVVELLNQSNELAPYLPWSEGNANLGNRTTVRVELPTVGVRQLGQAVATSTSRVTQFDDTMSIIEAWNEVDCKLAELGGDVGMYRYEQMLPYFEAMSQKFAYLSIYGDTGTNPGYFYGLTPRYATVSSSISQTAQNVIDGGGTGSVNTSVWFTNLGLRGTKGIFPKGSRAGLSHDDLGKTRSQTVAAFPSTSLMVYADRYTWDCGIVVTNWLWNVRICNIDTTNLVGESGAADLLKLFTKAKYRFPSISFPASATGNPTTTTTVGLGTIKILCNRTVREMLEIQAEQRVWNQLKFEDILGNGHKVLTWSGFEILNMDQITNSEGRVV